MSDNILDSFDFDSFDFDSFDNIDSGIDVRQDIADTPDIQNIVTSLKKRAMIVFFVIDISGSMQGARIGSVNDAIRNVLPELKKRERSNTSAEIMVAILEFSTRANWRTLAPQPVSSFVYEDIVNVGGGTSYGSAFAALNDKLSRKQFMNAAAGAYTPLIIFMTDGKPSDMGLYPEELDKLRRNKWFQYSTRAGIAIEEGAMSPECKAVLKEFTGNESNVYEAKNTIILARQIELVTLTGVDFVTQQGSLQNNPLSQVTERASVFTSSYNTAPPSPGPANQNSALPSRMSSPAPTPTPAPALAPTPAPAPAPAPAPQNLASPSLPIGDIDWENDFNF